MSIDQFRSAIATKGVARPNRFEATIYPPTNVHGGQTNRDLNLRVKTIDMPGRNISTTTNDTIYGPTHELAMGLTYADEITVTFIVSSALEEKKWLDSWQEYIYNPRTYTLNFYKDYVGTMELYQLNEQNLKTYGIRMLEVFPKTVNPISYSQDGVSALQELSVGFAFKEWEEILIGSTSTYDDAILRYKKPTSISEEQTTIVKPSKPAQSDQSYIPNRYSTPEQRGELPDMTVDTIG